MKTIIRLFAAFAAITAVLSCSKDLQVSDSSSSDVNLVPFTIEVSIPGTKATIDGLQVLWQSGDKIAVYDGTAKREFTLTGGEGTKNATFSGELDASATKLSAVYPYSAAGDIALTYTLPKAQTIPAGGTMDPSALIMCAAEVSKGETLAFKNSCGVARMTVPAGTSKVMLCSDNFYTLDFTEVPAESVSVDMILPAGEYPDFKMLIKTSEGGFAKTTDKTLTINTGKIKSLGDVKGTPACLISNGAEFKSFLESSEKLAAYVIDDIDLNGIELVDTATIKTSFNGLGHPFRNWASNGKNLFRRNNGTIENVVIDASCTLSGNVSGNFGFLVSYNSSHILNCTNNANVQMGVSSTDAGTEFHFGVLVGHNEGTTVTNAVLSGCTNNGNIALNVDKDLLATTYLGSLCGKSQYSKVLNCTNNGEFIYTSSEKQSSYIYFGGIVASLDNSDTLISGCKNYGNLAVRYNQGSAAAAIIGGVAGYTPDGISQCHNYGDVEYRCDGDIKGTLVAGVTAYTVSPAEDCTNAGNVTVSGHKSMGGNGIGTYTDTAPNIFAKSSATVLVGGVIAGGAPKDASTFPFSASNCVNSGNISYSITKATASDETSTNGRHCVGGVIGDASGPLTDCSNTGNVTVSILAESGDAVIPKNAGYTVFVGGVAGSNYYSIVQNELNMTDCSNSGSVSLTTYIDHTKTSMVGGVVGWPGKESKNTTTRSRCVNSGEVSVFGYATLRVGGVQGNSGNIENCRNTGDIYAEEFKEENPNYWLLGGVSGFHSGGYSFLNNVSECTMESPNKVNVCAGGLVGFFGNAAMEVCSGCNVNCSLVNGDLENVGLVTGGFNGTTCSITVGTAESPVKVQGSVRVGSTTTAINSSNFTDYLHGSFRFTESKHVFHAEFGGVL